MEGEIGVGIVGVIEVGVNKRGVVSAELNEGGDMGFEKGKAFSLKIVCLDSDFVS